jgi:glyoxylase-like metal-dependent hydrolase (beta-lactamase superfamily II)
MGVVVQDRDHRVFLAGDTSYTQDLMLRQVVDGVSPDEELARATLARVNQFVIEEPTVYLVAHDPETGIRLAERRAVSFSSRQEPPGANLRP